MRSHLASILSLGALLSAAHGCVGYEPGIERTLSIRPSPEGALGTATLGDGTVLTELGGSIDVLSAELVGCGGDGGHHHGAIELHWLLPVAHPRLAQAQHHHASPLIIEGPFLIDTAVDETELPERFSPAPGCYDRLRVRLGSLVMGVRVGDRYLSLLSHEAYTANIPFDPPLELGLDDDPTPIVIALSSAPFALLGSLEGATGDRVLAGLAAQADLVE
jgi:hypothetical protein